MTGDFIPSPGQTVGMEMEFQLVDPISLDLVDQALPLLEFFPDRRFAKPELIQNTIEVASEPCDEVGSLLRNLRELVGGVANRVEKLNVRLCGSGTRPVSQRLALVTPLPRYLDMEQASGLISHTQISFARPSG